MADGRLTTLSLDGRLLPPPEPGDRRLVLELRPAHLPRLHDGSVSRVAIAHHEYWRLLTAGFLHAGLFHLMFNMLALYILGGLLEPAVGRFRFGLIYFVSLLCGSFGALLLAPNEPTVGASGAIFGLMGAAVIVMRNRGLS